MLKVGLTGSIAVGKSFVLSVLKELGCRTIDADQVARDVVGRGTPGLQTVIDNFGEEVLQPDGSLDRPKLGAVVFGDESKRRKLNSILHPFIIARQDELLRKWEQETPDAIAVVDAALMIESGGYKRFDKLIVVYCRPEIQLQRLMSRENLNQEEAGRRINSQMSQEEKKKYADFLIDTSDGFDSARAQTAEVWHRLQPV